MNRKCGILLPVSSLPSEHGIGCFSKEAYEFVDFLKAAGQSCWQILPLGPTGYGDSPYQSFSTFAGNPYFIDLEKLLDAGYLGPEDLALADFGDNPGYVDYGKMYAGREKLLAKAYHNSPFSLHPDWDMAGSGYDQERAGFEAFIRENESWLDDFALFTAIKRHYQGKPWSEWDEDIRTRKAESLLQKKTELADEIRCIQFEQYEFSLQWQSLKTYANQNGIDIVGDIPIYVAFDSADTWSHPELFLLDEKGFPTEVSGCPPDAFSTTGQLWGNPIYKWDYHRETGYAWWLERLRHCFLLYDVVRIDHFRGFDEYWAIPYGDPTAEGGRWEKGPGYDLFAAIKENLGDKKIIAEDLGYLTPTVLELVAKCGYPGMKVLEFAFDAHGDSGYLPHNYRANCVVYTGTHDNETMRGWYNNISGEDRDFVTDYLDIPSEDMAAIRAIRAAYMSVADTAIIPMQDWLNLGNEARINHPSTTGNNWKWRMLPGQDSKDLAEKILGFARTYRRM